jgi:hypothetical protein
MPTTHLYIDLEDTIIAPVAEGWTNVHLVNSEKVKAFIQELKPDHVHIFSFAIHSDHDRMLFNMWVRERLERALGVTFGFVPTTDEITEMTCRGKGISPQYTTFNDLCDFFGKAEAFRQVMRHQWKGVVNHPNTSVNVILLDDDVINESFTWPDLKIEGRTINVNKL